MTAREFAPEVIEAAAEAIQRTFAGHDGPYSTFVEDWYPEARAAADALYETVRAEVAEQIAQGIEDEVAAAIEPLDDYGIGMERAARIAREAGRAVLADPDAVTS